MQHGSDRTNSACLAIPMNMICRQRKRTKPAGWGWWEAGGCSAVAAWLWEGLCWCTGRRQGVPGCGAVWL